jgi:uncharacterized membrane protein HdeD (DUF308 family)
MDVLERNWWAIGLRGIVALVFGLGALFRPLNTLLLMVALFGAWWVVDGALTIVAAVYAAEHHERSLSLFVEGIAGVLLGVAVYFLPGMTTLSLVLFIALWAAVTGAARVFTAVRLRDVLPNDWMMATSGALSVLFAALVWTFPLAGATALVVGVGSYATVLGVLLIVLAARLYGFRRWHDAHSIHMRASR